MVKQRVRKGCNFKPHTKTVGDKVYFLDLETDKYVLAMKTVKRKQYVRDSRTREWKEV